MTVSTTTDSTTVAGTGAQTVFGFSFNNGVPTGESAPLAAYALTYTDASGNQTVLNPTQYTLAFNAALVGGLWGIGGTITYPLAGSPIATGTTLTLQRVFSYQQLTSIRNQGDFAPQVIEQALDVEEMQTQQIANEIGRAIQIPIVDNNINTTLPAAVARANLFAAFDGSGNVIAALPASGTFPISSVMAPVVSASTLRIAQMAFGIRQVLTFDTIFHVNASTGVDAITGGSVSAPWATLQYARNTVQAMYDLAGYNITFNCVGAFTAGLYAQGSLTGQQSPTSENWAINGSVTVVSGATAFEAVYNAQYQVSVPTGSLSVVTSGAGGVGFGASAGGFINLVGQVTIYVNGGWSLVTSWGGTIIHNNIFTLGSGFGFSFASGGVIQGDNGATVTYDQANMVYSIANYWAYAGGVIGLGVTFVGGTNVTGQRYLASFGGVISTGNQGAAYIPGTVPGTTIEGGVYDSNVPAQQVFNSITGCLPTSVSGSHTTAAITVASGTATDSTNVLNIVGAGYNWAAANGNAANGTDAASSTLLNSTTYHMYLCMGPSGVCTYASSNLNPAGPTGYQAYKRRIFSFLTNSSGAPIPFTAFESEGGSYTLYYSTVIQDANAITLTATQAAIVISTPLGIITKYLGRLFNSDTSNYVLITSPLEANTLPTSQFADAASIALAPSFAKFEVETNTSQQITGRASGTATTAVSIWACGYKDFRRS